MSNNFDLIVIGGGPGGYVAAIRASQLGLKTALIEREHLGGICLNWGCIPTKALLKASEINHLLHHLDDYGFTAKEISFDFKKIIERSRSVSAKLVGGIKHLLKKNKVTVFEGTGSINGKNLVKVTRGSIVTELSSKHIIIATGARARVLPGFEPDHKFIWSYKEAMSPTQMPKSLIVVGSGAIGVEFASFYRNMGSEVTIVEMVDRILPAEDEEISALAQKEFEQQQIKIMTNCSVNTLKKNKNDITLTLSHAGKDITLTAEKVIMAVGIVPNTEHLGLEGTKVKLERGIIQTNPYSETAEPGIYAIGDVTSGPWLAHKASHEGVICVEKIAGLKVHPMRKENIPGCTYARPQIASLGLTEKQALEAGYKLKIGRFPLLANGKALAIGETTGLIKTIFDEKTGELLGVHLIGAEVTEMIQGFCIGKTMEATELDFMHTIFPHPTISESMHESVLAAYNRAIHI